MVTNCTDDQIKSLTRTNLILRKLICQTPTNRSEVQCVVQFDTLFTGVLVSCRQKLSSRNQCFNRAPGSCKSHFGIGSRSEKSINGMTPPLYPFPLAFHPVNEASCRPPSPQPKPGAFASNVGGGGSGDCQSLADIPCNVVGGGPVNPSGERGVDHCYG